MFGAFDHRARQAGKLGDLNAIGTIGGALHDLVQEDDIALPIRHAHGEIDDARKLFGELRQLVKMRGEERARAIDLMQMFHHRPGDGEPVEGRRAAADLIQR